MRRSAADIIVGRSRMGIRSEHRGAADDESESGGRQRVSAMLERFEHGDKLALARLITLVENRAPESSAILERVYSCTGRAHLVGITGPPGAGKSTLLNCLIASYRKMDRKIAVLAIDPSSPFSGGAVLGDRVRMTDHYRDPGVYIRSLSSRGSHGGLSRAAGEIVKLLDAFGHDVVITETVGVGQTELGIMDLADTVVLVTVPEGGDAIQVMKAGLNEIAEIFVVNKADREGAGRLKAELELSVRLQASGGWRPPVILTQARDGLGVDDLVAALAQHLEFVRARQDALADGERRTREFFELAGEELEQRAMRGLRRGEASELVARIRAGGLNPYAAVRELLSDRDLTAQVLAGGAKEPE